MKSFNYKAGIPHLFNSIDLCASRLVFINNYYIRIYLANF